jgi:glycosyltransferase involved in cell wall biosynthesis
MSYLQAGRKILIVPGACDALGGTLVTLSLLIQGFALEGEIDSLVVLVSAGSVMEQYLKAANQKSVLHIIPANNKGDFVRLALTWVNRQPKNWPLLLDNCIERSLLLNLIQAAPKLRLSGRPIYHFCHDLGLSRNRLGYWSRKLAFGLLAPKALCNSNFTASHIRTFIPDVQGVLYQPVDMEQFSSGSSVVLPKTLKPIVASGAKIMLTPSRINQAGIVNDKNLRALIPVLAELKQLEHFYHGVVIGEDRSPGQVHTQELLAIAEDADVADRFTILPPTFDIVSYYRFADVVVTLAPREPFGRTVVEAIACGIPVIGSQTGGIGEILGHIAPDWRVDSEAVSEVAQKIVQVLADPETPRILEQGRVWVESRCSISQYALDMMELTGLISQKDDEKTKLASA